MIPVIPMIKHALMAQVVVPLDGQESDALRIICSENDYCWDIPGDVSFDVLQLINEMKDHVQGHTFGSRS